MHAAGCMLPVHALHVCGISSVLHVSRAVACCMPHASWCRLVVACCKLRAVRCTFRVACSSRLHAVCCMPHAAWCTLHAVRCIVPISVAPRCCFVCGLLFWLVCSFRLVAAFALRCFMLDVVRSASRRRPCGVPLAAGCMLRVACCLLHAACCILFVAS